MDVENRNLNRNNINNANADPSLMTKMKEGAKEELKKAQIEEDKVNGTQGVDTNPDPENLMGKFRENFNAQLSSLKAGAAETIDSIKQAVGLAPKADHLPIPEHGQDAYEKTAPMAQTMFVNEELACPVHYEPSHPHPQGSPSASSSHPHWEKKYHSPKAHQDAYDDNASLGQDLFAERNKATGPGASQIGMGSNMNLGNKQGNADLTMKPGMSNNMNNNMNNNNFGRIPSNSGAGSMPGASSNMPASASMGSSSNMGTSSNMSTMGLDNKSSNLNSSNNMGVNPNTNFNNNLNMNNNNMSKFPGSNNMSNMPGSSLNQQQQQPGKAPR